MPPASRPYAGHSAAETLPSYATSASDPADPDSPCPGAAARTPGRTPPVEPVTATAVSPIAAAAPSTIPAVTIRPLRLVGPAAWSPDNCPGAPPGGPPVRAPR